MRVSDLARLASQLVKVELLIAEIQLKVQGNKFLLGLVAVGALLFGVVMLNVAGYQWLTLQYGPVMAPLGIALADILLAAIALMIAFSMRAGPELLVAQELRKTLLDDIDKAFTLNTVKSGQASVFDLRTLQVLLPAIVTVVGAMRRHRKGVP
jgi:hypothetical protein